MAAPQRRPRLRLAVAGLLIALVVALLFIPNSPLLDANRPFVKAVVRAVGHDRFLEMGMACGKCHIGQRGRFAPTSHPGGSSTLLLFRGGRGGPLGNTLRLNEFSEWTMVMRNPSSDTVTVARSGRGAVIVTGSRKKP